MIAWVPADRVADALRVLAVAQGEVRQAWTQGRTDRPATGAQMRSLRESRAGRTSYPNLYLRLIFTDARDATLFKLSWVAEENRREIKMA